MADIALVNPVGHDHWEHRSSLVRVLWIVPKGDVS
jgi:hypothetical protein